MSRGLDNFHSSYVYRVLRPNEDPNSDLSCCAPLSIRTISQHVATGLRDPSRYISTTSSIDKALKWIDTSNGKSSWRYGNKRSVVVKINVDYLKTNHPEIANSAYDLTKNLNRLNFLNSQKERSFSCAYDEVVFVDRIPKGAVSIEYIHGKGFVNQGDLSRRTTNPIKYSTLSASTTNSVIPSSSPKIVKCKETYRQFLEQLAQLKISPTPMSSSSDSSDSEDAVYQLKSTLYKPSDVTRLPSSNLYAFKNPENTTVQPVIKPRPILINSSIKSPEKRTDYTHSYSMAKVPSQVRENNPLRKTLPDYSLNVSPDSDSYSDSSEDETKRAFISEVTRAFKTSQVAARKTNPSDVTRIEVRPSPGSNIQNKIEISENIPVERTLPSYKPIPYPRSIYFDGRAENRKIPEAKQVNKPMSETYSVDRQMDEVSKLRLIPPPEIGIKVKIPVVVKKDRPVEGNQQLSNTASNFSPYQYPPSQTRYPPTYLQSGNTHTVPPSDAKSDFRPQLFRKAIVTKAVNDSTSETHPINRKITEISKLKSIPPPEIAKPFSASKVKIPVVTNIERTVKEKQQLDAPTPSYYPHRYVPKIPLSEANAAAKSDDSDTYLLRRAIASRIPLPTSVPIADTNSVRTPVATGDKPQFRSRIAGKSESQTIHSILYPPHRFTQIRHNH